jgi:enamine deaminase RidA (YjgF/YER057c/UK114 family)
MSQAVVHGDTVYLAGQVADGDDVKAQTRGILARIDELLAAAGSDKSKILSATVWLVDIDTWSEMNVEWDAWVDTANPPARAAVEAKLAVPKYLVEIGIVAAV